MSKVYILTKALLQRFNTKYGLFNCCLCGDEFKVGDEVRSRYNNKRMKHSHTSCFEKTIIDV